MGDGRILLIVINALCLGLVLGAFSYSWLLFQPFILENFSHNHTGIPLFPETCLLKAFAGYPCPSCGMSRAMVMIARGNLLEAFRFNLMSLPLFFSALAFMGFTLLSPRKALQFVENIGIFRGIALVFACMLLAWVVKLMGPQLYW